MQTSRLFNQYQRQASVLIICIMLIVFTTTLLTFYIRSMSRYHGAAISDVFNTYAELAMRNGQIHAMHTLQRAALVDDPDHPDFYSTFHSSWRSEFRRDKTLEDGGEWPDAKAMSLGSASWALPQHNVPSRSGAYRTYGPGTQASSSDRMSDGMLQILGWKRDGQSTLSNGMQFTIGANAGARWFESNFLDGDGQPLDPADKDDARYVVRYAVEMIDLSGFMGFNFYPEENVDWSSLSPDQALQKRRYFRALRERYGSVHMAHMAWEQTHPWSKITYNVLPRSTGSINSTSLEPKFLAFRHHLEPYRLEDDPFKVEMDNNSFHVWAPQVPRKFIFWSFHRAKFHQIYDLFQGHGQIWTGNMNALVYKTQVNPGPYYSYQNLASALIEGWDNMDDIFYRPHTYNLFDTGLHVENGDDCYSPFRINILTATPLSLGNAFQRHMGHVAFQSGYGSDQGFDGPPILSFPFAIGDPLIPFSNDSNAADLYDDNFKVGQAYTYSNTADAPVDSTLDTWFERTGSMFQWFYGLDYNEGRQIGPRYRPNYQNSILQGYGNWGRDTAVNSAETAKRFTRRHKFELNTSQSYEHDVLEAMAGAVFATQKIWNGQSQRHRYGWDPGWADNTNDHSLERLQKIWEDFAWMRTGSASSTIADIEDNSKNELATIHDVERFFLRILGEKIDEQNGNARGNGVPYNRQDPSTWRALPRALAGVSLPNNSYPKVWSVQDDRVKNDHVLAQATTNAFRYVDVPEKTRLRDHQNTAGMERFLNDVRMSYFGSPAIDFNFDGFAESSVNGWNDGGDNITTWMTNFRERGGQKIPDLDTYGPGSRDTSGSKVPLASNNVTYQTLRDQHVDWMELDQGADNSRKYGFSACGRLYMGKSNAYRIFIRGQVWDLIRNKKTSEVNLDMVYSPNPSDNPMTYTIEDTDLADSHVIMQRPIRNYQMTYSEDNFTE